jgi:hypothetical protein
MIIYFAGSGRKVEDSERIIAEDNEQWGVLLSYKDQQTKDNQGSKRFQKLHSSNVSNNKSVSKR